MCQAVNWDMTDRVLSMRLMDECQIPSSFVRFTIVPTKTLLTALPTELLCVCF